MKFKKIVILAIVLVLIIAQFSWMRFGKSTVYAAEEAPKTIATKYFYEQLTTEQKKFYNALEAMLENGMLLRRKRII